MQKIKVVTFKGALKMLGVSNRTFYEQYRKFVKPCGTQGKSNLYAIEDLERRKQQIEQDKMYNAKFEIVE